MVFGKLIQLRDELAEIEQAIDAARTGRGDKNAASSSNVIRAALRYQTATCGGCGRGSTLPSGSSHQSTSSALEAALSNDAALVGRAMAFLGGVQSVATDLSRAPTFRRRFGSEVLRGFGRSAVFASRAAASEKTQLLV